jgi:hypothetical protein
VFQKLVNHNGDIERLVKKGYAVAFDSNYVIIRDIPYLDAQGQLHWGALAAKLVFADQTRVIQDDHQVFFAGGPPHGLDGKPIPNLADRQAKLTLTEACRDVVVERRFSNKPKKGGKFTDFYEKIESYVTIISGPAMEKHGVNPYTFRTVKVVPDSVFKFHDTLTSRAEIGDLSVKFKDDIVAVIGLGGTGAYVLDLLVRTPVREIRAFDLDGFHVHNAFRSPGRTEESEFRKPKAQVYAERYGNFRHGLAIIPKLIDAACVQDLEGVTFAFVCVDKGSSRAGIFDLLLERRIPFIDVGMGLNRKHKALNGMLRATYYSAENGADVRQKKLAEEVDNENDVYRTNIQTAELNALNACLAVIRFKQIRKFYFQEVDHYHLTFKIGDSKIIGASFSDEA